MLLNRKILNMFSPNKLNNKNIFIPNLPTNFWNLPKEDPLMKMPTVWSPKGIWVATTRPLWRL